MSSIASRSRAATKRIVSGVLVAILCAPPVPAAKRPRFGGTLRVELRESTLSLDPREWKRGSGETAANERVAGLIFDRLLSVDAYGRFQPQLATEWSHDASFRRWQFIVRGGVKFSDGSFLAGSDVESALQPLLPAGVRISASGNALAVQSQSPMPDLLEQLASGRYFIFREARENALVGTGPFVLADITRGKGEAKPSRYTFTANDSCWAGRPFLDSIEITPGLSALSRLFDLQVGKADLIELAPELVRRAQQENLRVWASDPVTLFGLRFEDGQAASSEAKLREALSLSLDRATMAGVLLQKQAEPAAALLPDWLSGYAFLFNVETDIERAKAIRSASSPPIGTAANPLRLRVDAPGELAKLLGERVAVNARQGGITLEVLTRTAQRPTQASDPPAMHLFAWHFESLSPRAELDTMDAVLQLSSSSDRVSGNDEIQLLYERERKILDERRILPLVILSEYVGLGANVRDWMPARWGEWHLADAWLETSESAPARKSRPQPALAPTGATL